MEVRLAKGVNKILAKVDGDVSFFWSWHFLTLILLLPGVSYLPDGFVIFIRSAAAFQDSTIFITRPPLFGNLFNVGKKNNHFNENC